MLFRCTVFITLWHILESLCVQNWHICTLNACIVSTYISYGHEVKVICDKSVKVFLLVYAFLYRLIDSDS